MGSPSEIISFGKKIIYSAVRWIKSEESMNIFVC